MNRSLCHTFSGTSTRYTHPPNMDNLDEWAVASSGETRMKPD